MAAALPYALTAEKFAFTFQQYGDLAFALLALVLMLWAFIHALFQRSDAFVAIGTLQKVYWLLILGGCLLLSLLEIQLLQFIGITAAALYLLDVRRGLKDAVEGHW